MRLQLTQPSPQVARTSRDIPLQMLIHHHRGVVSRSPIARGEAIFNTRRFVIDNVPGLNGRPEDPLRRPIQNGTCTICHDTPNVGVHSVPMALNIGVADASRRTADLPLYTLRRRATGETVQTTDPGRAMLTGKWNDIGKSPSAAECRHTPRCESMRSQ